MVVEASLIVQEMGGRRVMTSLEVNLMHFRSQIREFDA